MSDLQVLSTATERMEVVSTGTESMQAVDGRGTLEVISTQTEVMEVVSTEVELMEVAVIGPRGPGNLVTFETGHEPTLVGVPDGTLWVEYA